ncbi:MAG: DUF1549 and DUF1553 domain-containing protein [Planctomycetia bacterium]|nr:DUF1549 and DUF1553 domain-containing protein [Planctomycetia bacterium]
MIRLYPALAVAAVFLAVLGPAGAGDLRPADRPIAEVVDAEIDAALARESVPPAPPADPATLIRRLTLDLAGRIPTANEFQAYLESTDPEKTTRLVDRLMASPGFVRHQATEFDTMLMAGSQGSLRDYLVKAFGENLSWDRVFRELMLPDESDKARRPAAEFLRRRLKDLDRLTTDVSATFFGVNISCAQCHDHPLVADWKQDHFFGMKAFVSRTFDNGEFVGERAYGSVSFKTTEGVERKARMMFLSGTRVDEGEVKEPSKDEQKAEKEQFALAKKQKVPPPAPAFSARSKLVEVALEPGDRDFFARSIVNRVWHRLFGRGLVTPLDQMHSANPPSHPDLLAWLARDTVEHGYDLRRLIRGLVLSRAYTRSSRWDGNEAPRASLFAVAAVRPLTPSQLASSLRLATADPATLPADLKADDFEKRVEALENNGRAVRNVLSRPPDEDDLRVLGAYLEQRPDRPEEACRQVVWALLTCAEFRFNH